MPHLTFIHGICNKPARDVLLKLWKEALAGDDGVDFAADGVSSSMAYWADVIYEAPLAPEAAEERYESDAETKALSPVRMDWRTQLGGAEGAWVEAVAHRLNFEANVPADVAPSTGEHTDARFERIPLPGFLKRRLMETYLRDVHHYLYNTTFSPRPGTTYAVRDEVRTRLINGLRGDGTARQPGPHVLLSHSLGTVVAYDCLKRVSQCPPIDALMTVGSPLGLDEVQDQLRPEAAGQDGWSRQNGFPSGDRLRSRWVNIFDPLDPVAGFDPRLANDYEKQGAEVVEDVLESNYGKWRHDISKYLGQPRLRAALRQLLGLPAA